MAVLNGSVPSLGGWQARALSRKGRELTHQRGGVPSRVKSLHRDSDKRFGERSAKATGRRSSRAVRRAGKPSSL